MLLSLLKKPFTKFTSHKDSIEGFYKDQAATYDMYREKFLWGRPPLISVCEAYLRGKTDIVWFDIGGGTAYNILLMEKLMPLQNFKQIYIIDICESLCAQARQKCTQYGWTNVEVICDDACTFTFPEAADIITMSYSLSMIPTFHTCIDNCFDNLKESGYIAVADFYVSERYDKPERQMSWINRNFWKTWFDIDNIQLGPERRAYLEHMFHTIHEHNSYGSIPYLRFLNAPYYVWIGTKDKEHAKTHVSIQHTKAPPLFPPTFLYHQCWEDPDVDAPFLDIQESDTCLTLTSGGCNTLHLLLHGAKEVVSVDVNPAQTALLELKAVVAKHTDYETFWKMFGEGKHEDIDTLYASKLAPFLSTVSKNFWNKKKHYFKSGLYNHGSMGKVSIIINNLCKMLGINVHALVNSEDMTEQKEVWNSTVESLTSKKAMIQSVVTKLFGLVFLNKIAVWYGGGVPAKQLEKIKADKTSITDYVMRCLDGVFKHSHINTENYFYLNILMGKYTPECCPSYLKPENFKRLNEDGLLHRLVISNDFFLNELRKRRYDKVILMDHTDWQTKEDTEYLASVLSEQVRPGGRVIMRSAGLRPIFVDQMESHGFHIYHSQTIDKTPFMDRVNMYASFYVFTRK